MATGYVSLSTFVTFSLIYIFFLLLHPLHSSKSNGVGPKEILVVTDLEVKEASFYFIFFLFLAHGIQNFPD